MARNADDIGKTWSRRRQDLAVILWCAFLVASLATMVFFAVFDPVLLMHDADPPLWLANRSSGYAAGFFFFWAIAALAAALTARLIDRSGANAQQADKFPPARK